MLSRKLDISLDRAGSIVTRFWAKVDISGGPDACWPWTACTLADGHGMFGGLCGQSVSAHRFSWMLRNGVWLDRADWRWQVCHDCPGGDNPACCNPAHLWLGTQAENMEDCVRKGRSLAGERNPSAQLTEADVCWLRQRRAEGALYRELAAETGIPLGTVHQAVTGKTWKDLAVPPCPRLW
jgi:hypothetical protein